MKGIDTMSNSTNTNLSSLFFATKSRGSSSADGSTATYNATTRRLTIGAFYYNDKNYRSGAVALDKQNNIIVRLSKKGFDKQNSAIHSTQYFFTVVKNSPARAVLDKNRKYSVEELGDDLFKLTPQNS